MKKSICSILFLICIAHQARSQEIIPLWSDGDIPNYQKSETWLKKHGGDCII